MDTSKATSIRRIEIGIEECILGIIIVFNILAVLGLLSVDLDYVKKLISWSAVGYLLYQTRPIRLFTGSNDKVAERLLLVAYFMLFVKNFVAMAHAKEGSWLLQPLYDTLLANATYIELFGLHIGLVLFVYLAIRMLLRPVHPRSILGLLGCEKVSGVGGQVKKFLLIFSVIVGFFIVIFSLFMEWLAVAIDAPLLMSGIVFYLFFVVRHKHRLHPDSLLHKFGNFGNDLYQNIIEHLKYRHTALRVLAGMLVLHLITDAFIFLWSYVTGVADQLYFGPLGRMPLSMIASIRLDSQLYGVGPAAILTIAGLLGMTFFLLFPVLVWYDLYKHEHTRIHHSIIGICFIGIVSLLLAPTMRLVALKDKAIHGVDIITTQLAPRLPVIAIIAILLICGVGSIWLSKRHFRPFAAGLVTASLLFLTWYVAMFYESLVSYYTTIIPALWQAGFFVLGGFLTVIFLLTTAFYLVATVYFVIDVIKHIKEQILIE